MSRAPAIATGSDLVRPLARRGRALGVSTIQPRPRGLVGALREAWAYRWCIGHFGRMSLLKRYQRTWLGFVWVPLRPAFNMGSKLLIFGGVIGISAGRTPYPIFFLVTTAAWQLFAETALWGTRSLEIARGAFKRLEVPRLPVMLGSILPGSVEFAVYLVFATLGIVWYVVRAHVLYLELTPRSVLAPAGLVLILLLGLGVGLLTSAQGARARDIRFGMQFALGFLYFATPVLYPLSQIPAKWRPLAELNPVTGALEMTKDGLFGTHELTPPAALVTGVAVVLLWIPVLWLYHRADVRRGRRR